MGKYKLAKIYNGSPDSCSIGQLLDQGVDQVRKLAHHLKEAYPDNFIAPDNVYLYSTDTQRTFATMDILAANLFPLRKGYRSSSRHTLPVNTHEFTEDFFALNMPHCKRFTELRTTFPTSADYLRLTNSEDFEKCKSAWRGAFGTDLDLKYADDCMISAHCNKATLPNNLPVPDDILNCVIKTSFELRAIKLGGVVGVSYYDEGQEVCRFGSYKVFSALNNAVEHGFKAGLYSIHDETFVCLLTVIAMWDGVWPKYASYVAFEFYNDDVVRVVRDGIEVGLTTWPLRIESILNDQEWANLCDGARPSHP